jgi:Ser/Thr protein kinase RdoA (MazF antagonist)
MSPGAPEPLAREELRAVVRAFGLRGPVRFESIGRGASRTTKGRLTAGGARFMLKRRPAEAMPEAHAAFLHRFQAFLRARGVPVPEVLRTSDGASEYRTELAAVELSQWVEGSRWSCTEREAASAGRAVGSMFAASTQFDPGPIPPGISFHREGTFVGVGGPVLDAALRSDPGTDAAALREALECLGMLGQQAWERAESTGFSSAGPPPRCIHGDLHPGNAVFGDGALRALVDFDSARVDRRACELAAALLHFANHPTTGDDPATWREDLDLGRMQAFADACGAAFDVPLERSELAALPWLMIEACALETLVPIARAGRFARVRASMAVPFFVRKCEWIARHVPPALLPRR